MVEEAQGGKTLGRAVCLWRLERKWTQKELARRSGLDRGYIANLETGIIGKPGAPVLSGLARAFGITIERLYELGGYIPTSKRIENIEEILERLRLAQPVAVPVYMEFPFHAGDPVEPVEYVYRTRTKPTPKGIEGYIVHGSCLAPTIEDGDIIIVDRNGAIEVGDIVAALIDNMLTIGRLRKIEDVLYVDNTRTRFELGNSIVAPIIEVIRRLK